MSHFTVMVIGADPEDQLAPFNENLDTPRYVKYTKQQLIEKGKKYIQDYKVGVYDKYMANPIEYSKDSTQGHLDYLQNEFPKRLNWTDEEIYVNEIENYEDVGQDGEVYSTYNPNSKWDWYQLGGRWSGSIKLKAGARGEIGKGSSVMGNEGGIDSARKGDIANLDELTTFALLKDGKWYERGSMGWWGIVVDGKDENQWELEIKKLLADIPDDTLISIYDCHI